MPKAKPSAKTSTAARPKPADQPAPPDPTLRPALEALAARDPEIATAYQACGLPPVRGSEPGFAGLIRMIAGQQVSTQSARAIITRLEAALDPMTAEGFAALDDETLRSVGFSRMKVVYGRALASAILEGSLDIAALDRLDDAEVTAALTAVKGIGRWTAEVYLLFAMGRPDVWPAGDLAVVKAAQHLKGLAERPSEKAMRILAEPWRPHRSAAARFLWHYYRHEGVALQGRSNEPIATERTDVP